MSDGSGCKENTPLAIIENASSDKQKVYEATLATYEDLFQPPKPKGPALIVIGESVKIRGLIKDFQQTISTSKLVENAS